jgi:hypothetical protein
MPRYTPDFGAVSATLTIFDKGEYEFEVGKPKSFQREKDGGGESIGVRFRMTMAEGPLAGKSGLYSCYTHSDGGMSFAKQFVMATLGYDVTPEGEKRFDTEYKGGDWGFNTEDGTCGDLWNECAGRHVMASVDLGTNPKNGEQNQQWSKFRPFM